MEVTEGGDQRQGGSGRTRCKPRASGLNPSFHDSAGLSEAVYSSGNSMAGTPAV